METRSFRLSSESPLMMHSEKTVNPFDPLTVELKKLTGKRKKTDEDLVEIARLEFVAGTYWTPEAGYHIPGGNIESMLIASAKHFRLGQQVKQAVAVTEVHCPFKFSDDKLPPDKLWENKAYVDIRGVRVGTAKVNRCRPVFASWSVSFTAAFAPDKINPEDLVRVVENAGRYIGLGDFRPRYGRFTAEESAAAQPRRRSA